MALQAYLYIEGVQGESTSVIGTKPTSKEIEIPGGAGTGPIEVKSFGLNVEMPLVENRSATGAITVGRANFADFETSKSLDVSTISLLFFCLSGKHINKAVLAVYRAAGEDDSGTPTLYMRAVYENLVITEVGVSGSGDEVPSETLKFSYGKVEYKYYRTDAATGKSAGGPARYHWNRIENTGGKEG